MRVPGLPRVGGSQGPFVASALMSAASAAQAPRLDRACVCSAPPCRRGCAQQGLPLFFFVAAGRASNVRFQPHCSAAEQLDVGGGQWRWPGRSTPGVLPVFVPDSPHRARNPPPPRSRQRVRGTIPAHRRFQAPTAARAGPRIRRFQVLSANLPMVKLGMKSYGHDTHSTDIGRTAKSAQLSDL